MQASKRLGTLGWCKVNTECKNMLCQTDVVDRAQCCFGGLRKQVEGKKGG